MSEIVCQVGNRADQVEFIWSSRGGYFKPYVVAGTQLTELRQAADQTRTALESLVFALNRDGAATPWEPSFELAEAGFRLFNYLLPSEDETAHKVRRWLEDLRKQSGLIGLEIVVEERSADAGTFLSVPWNLVYDERPAKYKAAFQKGQGVERWRPFWSARYNLTSGRRVEPLKRLPLWIDPRVVVVVDPTVHEDLNNEQKGRLDGFLAEAGLTAVGSLDELEAALEEGYPRLLYWLGHATPEYLMLGDKRDRPGRPAEPAAELRRPRAARGDAGVPERLPDGRGRVGRVVPGRAAQLRFHGGDRHRAADDRHLRQRVRPGVPPGVPAGGQAAGRVAARAAAAIGAAGPALRRPLPARDPGPVRRRRRRRPGAVADPRERPRLRRGPGRGHAMERRKRHRARRSDMGRADASRRGSSPARPAVPFAGLFTTRTTAPCSPAATPTSCGSPRRWTGRIRGS